MAATNGGDALNATELRLRLVGLWQEVLGVSEIGVDDEFFALGGNSALAVELVFRIASELGHRLPVRALVDAGTPALLAAAILRQRADQ